MKSYGFRLIDDNKEKEFTFTSRDWSVLTAYDEFSNVSECFRKLIAIDALEFQIGKKRYSIFVTRSKRYFMQQLSAVKSYFELEKKDLSDDFRVLIQGEPSALKKISCEYMGYSASVTCYPGFCTLRAYDMGNGGDSRDIIKIDLRRFDNFSVDNHMVLKLKRKTKDCSISERLAELSDYVENQISADTLKIELIGGDH